MHRFVQNLLKQTWLTKEIFFEYKQRPLLARMVHSFFLERKHIVSGIGKGGMGGDSSCRELQSLKFAKMCRISIPKGWLSFFVFKMVFEKVLRVCKCL